MAWRPDAFAAAGLPDPTPEWTLHDFEAACAALQGVVAAGKVNGLASVLWPMAGAMYQIADTSDHSPEGFRGSLYFPGLWVGFARGFGGQIVDKGRFTLTDPGTVAGLGRLVHMAARYAMPPARVPKQVDGISQLMDLFALDFFPYDPTVISRYGERWRFVRLPRFPVDPLIPTSFTGAGLRLGSPTPTGTPPKDLDRYVAAAAEFLTWSYGSEAQTLLAAAGVVPVLADPATQDRFWSASAPNFRAVGDWGHFVNYAEGWTAYPPDSIMGDTLSAAVQAPATLPALLKQAEQKMNAAVAAVG